MTYIAPRQNGQLFYYYLNPGSGESVKNFQLKCSDKLSSVKIPDWLEKTLPGHG